MPIPTLESLDATLNGVTLRLLGDTISYRIGGGTLPGTIKAFVDHAEGVRALGDTSILHQDIQVKVSMVDVEQRPTSSDRVSLPKVDAQLFQPINVERDESGMHWIFGLKKVIA